MIPIWELVSFSRNLSDVAVLSLNYLVPGTGTMVLLVKINPGCIFL